MQMPPGNPLLLSLTLQELLARDAVQRFKSCVYRRYNDFVVFHEMLLQKFPYRMVPALPPKRMLGADREFIEARRRALKRFINLVARHPPFSEDVVLKLFLSFSGPDVQNKLKESAQCVGDEFMNCKLAARAKDFLPADIQTQFAISRELIRNIYNSFHKLRDRAERMVSRAIDNAADLLIFGKELRQVTLVGSMGALGSDTTPLPSWATLNSSTWGSLKQALKGLSVEFALLADKAAQQGKQEENDVVEKLNLFLDLLQSYKVSLGCCLVGDRAVEKAAETDLAAGGTLAFWTLVSVTCEVQGCPRSALLLSPWVSGCADLHRDPPQFAPDPRAQGGGSPTHTYPSGPAPFFLQQPFLQMSKVWNDLQPKLQCLFAGPHGAPSPPRSPQDGLSPR
ncbi:hypothetical protein E2I00_001906 [Balaenoptera physalus]|uniref:PX domain-containing protein n=1 Tax=Balaenoptera physalus TaxID=9770 RepID=A0A6A1Q778_BALPH|nr:hypothetical protein E2I00_001906 [Balaenoptera physalus]